MHDKKYKDLDSEKIDYRIELVGNPNVGKSVLFGLLTGKYVTVSNYPGTTVEVSRGMYVGSNETVEVVDTPGANSLISHSEDERVARDILLRDEEKKIIQIIDAKNIQRGLLITTQLAEMGLPVSIGLNMWDETLDRGMTINTDKLQKILGVTLTRTIATQKYGINTLRNSANSVKVPKIGIYYGEAIEEGVKKIEKLLPDKLTVRKRAVAIMLLSYDHDLEETLELDKHVISRIHKVRDDVQKQFGHSLSYIIIRKRSDYVDNLLKGIVSYRGKEEKAGAISRNAFFFFIMPLVSFFIGLKVMDLLMFMIANYVAASGQTALILRLAGGGVSVGFYSFYLFSREYKTGRKITGILGTLTMHPVLAWPMLLVVLWGIYKIVGEFGAGDCVDFIENKIFGSSLEMSGGFDFKVFIPFTKIEYVFTHVNFQGINYYLGWLLQKFMSADNIIFELFMGSDAGIIQVGVTYSIAIILPIVGFFFVSFGLMEDSGYLPRLAVMLNRFFKIIGLNGKAVLPMVLG
ncbi:MAG: FeoB small GTPase domain-containing protein, partial [Candidatus Scalindua sp.]